MGTDTDTDTDTVTRMSPLDPKQSRRIPPEEYCSIRSSSTRSICQASRPLALTDGTPMEYKPIESQGRDGKKKKKIEMI